ncbi:hypothetical protein PHYPSEUDO_001530 [Phytophthora pseudosyringae]|uniref:Uncharacterized protein n=1 Tax=Phytophthora pseudosyringae TaxID=221518 RepID=A0A8T1VVZ4_9STRA|nr:hypothetical protein PHYPSEUDO_001530 [Phytophthora pseudosyringae]
MGNMLGMVLNTVVTGVDVLTGQILSVISLTIWLPLGLGAPSTLRYDIVRLVMRTFDFWFFSCTTTLTAVLISTYFWDLRFCRMMIDWIGFHNIVFIDGQVRGIRPLILVTILGILPLVFMLLWIMLERLDGCTSFSVLSHSNTHTNFSLSGVDIIGNGMITLTLLITKIVIRKRQTLRGRQRSSIVECVIYRCGLKLEQIEGPTIVHARRNRSSRVTSQKDVVAASDSSENVGRGESSLVQQMTFVEFPHTFDSNHVVFQLRISDSILVLVYGVGIVGLLLSFLVLINGFGDVEPELLFTQAWGGLLCSLVFAVPFVSLYQRDLFKLLVTSFDFFFYAFQTTTATLSVCILYNWERSQCLMLFTWWIWIQWALTLDSLTPTVRDKLHFRPYMAAPVVALVLLGHIALISSVFFVGDKDLHDSILYRGVIWDRELAVRAMPFYFSRIVTLSLWCPRLIWRLSTASKSEVTIIRGSVCYDNYFAKRGRSRSRGGTTKKICEKRQQYPFSRGRIEPTVLPGPRMGPTSKSLVAIQPD